MVWKFEQRHTSIAMIKFNQRQPPGDNKLSDMSSIVYEWCRCKLFEIHLQHRWPFRSMSKLQRKCANSRHSIERFSIQSNRIFASYRIEINRMNMKVCIMCSSYHSSFINLETITLNDLFTSIYCLHSWSRQHIDLRKKNNNKTQNTVGAYCKIEMSTFSQRTNWTTKQLITHQPS